jgi:kumamolisin
MANSSDLVALKGSTKKVGAQGDVLDEVPEGEFEVTIVVRRRNPLPPNEGEDDSAEMSREEHGLYYGADPEDIDKVASYAQTSGLQVVSSSLQRRTVRVAGDAASFQRAFGVELKISVLDGKRYRYRTGDIYLPPELQLVVTSVLGLDNRPFAKPHYRVGKLKPGPAEAFARAVIPAAPVASGFSPAQVAGFYHYPPYDGTGQTIAILELGGGFRQTELDTYFGQLGIKSPLLKVVPYPGCGTNNPGTNPLDQTNPDVEVMLDIQVAGSIVPGATILVYFAPDASDDSFFQALSAIVHDTTNNPNVISISWGGSEDLASDQFKNEMDQVLQFAKGIHVTVCVAAGDNGSADFDPTNVNFDGRSHVDFPASDPFVLGCGGTMITVGGNSIANEVTWNSPGNGSTGGGVSRFFDLPDYQNNAGVPAAMNLPGPVKRGVPDVAGNAAEESGYRILCDGQIFPDPASGLPAVGGTSTVAPLWAALIARINQALGKPVGFVNPALYALPVASGAFQDITVGNNGDYTAAPGWDPCTGLGSPNGVQLLNGLSGRV